MADATRSFVARIDNLVRTAPAVAGHAELISLLGCYLDILLDHRPVARLLVRCPESSAGWSCEAARAGAAVESVHRLLTGPVADLTDQVRATMAVAGLHGAVAGLPAGAAGRCRCSVEHTAVLRSAAMASSLSVLACRD
jgi:hypothetical protein